ncbi:uncharacterized protein LOC134250273 [Saccostrea cucullata]|uniref:uncharacterized protein LOC134250273 n=1 Tax=Saccostrea cuccullata TaxID=36930 RepID=UPI002ED52A2B
MLLKFTCLIVIYCIGNESTAFLLDGHANPSSASSQGVGTYNIYDKIDAIERELDECNVTLTEKVRDLEMSTQKKIHDMETMMRQVLLTVNQMDVQLNSDVHNMSLQIERQKNSTDGCLYDGMVLKAGETIIIQGTTTVSRTQVV